MRLFQTLFVGSTRIYHLNISSNYVGVFDSETLISIIGNVSSISESNNGNEPILTLTCGTRIRYCECDEWELLNDIPSFQQ
jgi:hypothetical protein